MQWMIDVILESMKGIVVMWSGAIADIPTGWSLCNGSNGTPDLRDKFIPGAGSTYAVGATGGNINHTHTFTSNLHQHRIKDGEEISSGEDYHFDTTDVSVNGTTDTQDGRPPYYALAYIMKD